MEYSDEFYPGQRWASVGEPELGVGVVVETSKNRVKIDFPSGKEARQYALPEPPLRRVVFKPGDTIVDSNNTPLLVENVQFKNGLLIYIAKERVL